MAKQQTLTIVVPDDADDPVDLVYGTLFDRGWYVVDAADTSDSIELVPGDFGSGGDGILIIEED